jgi:hypothetical protein
VEAQNGVRCPVQVLSWASLHGNSRRPPFPFPPAVIPFIYSRLRELIPHQHQDDRDALKLQVLQTKLQVFDVDELLRIFIRIALLCVFFLRTVVVMPLLEVLYPGSAVPGIRWHKPSGNYIAEIGYHKISHVAADGSISTNRIRTTHYLGDGDSRVEAEAKFAGIKDDWNRCVAEQRGLYDLENAQRRAQGLPSLPRFKPVWPKATTRRETAAPKTVQLDTHRLPITLPAPKPVLDLTIRAARDRYATELRKRIGLQNGKGINKNTFEKTLQSLDLGLALNKRYARDRRPIDVDMQLGELAIADYETFVQFWCDPQIITSPRTGQNYIGAFRQMLKRLKVPRPEGFDEVFNLKVPKTRKIARYDPEVLKPLLNCKDERADPVNGSDPSGHFDLVELGIVGTINAISFAVLTSPITTAVVQTVALISLVEFAVDPDFRESIIAATGGDLMQLTEVFSGSVSYFANKTANLAEAAATAAFASKFAPTVADGASAVVLDAAAMRTFFLARGLSQDSAAGYATSFANGSGVLREIKAGETFLRYSGPGQNAAGSFLTKGVYSTGSEAVQALDLAPKFGNDGSLVQSVTATQDTYVLEGGVANGAPGAYQAIAVDRNAFTYGPRVPTGTQP